jgi:hypothetical protein
MKSMRRIAFKSIASYALKHADVIVQRWLPDGRREGAEWVAINPARLDRCKGSFKINLRTGAWADFAINRRGGDLVALAAYLFQISQTDAALRIAEMLGVSAYE